METRDVRRPDLAALNEVNGGDNALIGAGKENGALLEF